MNKWAWVVIPIIIVLLAGTVINGVFYVQESNKLKDTQNILAALGEDVSDLEGGISTLEEGFSSLEGDVSTLEGGVSELQGNVSTLEGGVSTLEGNLSTLEGGVSTLEGNVSTLEGGVSALEGNLSTLEGGVSNLEGSVSVLEGDVLALEVGVSTLEVGVSTLEGNVSSLEGNVSTLEGGVSALGDDVSALEAHDRAVMDVVAMVTPSVVRIETNLGSGSGVIITNDGWVLTNWHVLNGAESIEITLSNGMTYDGVMPHIEHDFLDLAMVKIDSESTDFPAAVLGSSADLTVGEQVIAIGYPLWLELGDGATVTTGIVSAFRDFGFENFIQTDAAINWGNSGGPLINLKGEVIGINTWIVRDYEGDIWVGFGFAVPIDDAISFIEQVTG